MQELLGAKGQKLSDMNKMGLPVPYGFIITVDASRKYFAENHELDGEVRAKIIEKLDELRELTGTKNVVLNGTIICDSRELISNVLELFESLSEPEAVIVQEEIKGYSLETIYTRNPETGERDIEKQVSKVMRAFDIEKVANLLEKQLKRVQKVVFAYQEMEDSTEKMYILSTEHAKLSYYADIKTAVDFVDEGIISKQEAVRSVDPELFPKTDKILEGSTLDRLLSWADEIKDVKIRAEIKNAQDVILAKGVGAEAFGYYAGLDLLKKGELTKIYDNVESYGLSVRLSNCKRAVVNPDIVSIQVRDIFEAAISCAKKKDINVKVEIACPIAGTEKEMKYLTSIINEAAREVFERTEMEVPYFVAALIETSRAAINAGEIARHCESMIFDLEKLTENSLGLSEKSIRGVTDDYVLYGLFDQNPTKSIDRTGVGRMIEYAMKNAKTAKPKMRFSMIGPQINSEDTVLFAIEKNIAFIMSKVSDIPKLRIVAAQAVL